VGLLSPLLACLGGLLVLARAADHLVLGSSALARRLGVPAVIVGIVVIGFGTSAPELLVSGLAAAGGSMAIGVGNILGSTVANLTLVLGVAALMAPVSVHVSVVRRQAPLALLASAAFALAVQDGLTRAEGLILVLGLAAVLAMMLQWAVNAPDPQAEAVIFGGEVGELLEQERGYRLRRLVGQTLLGLVGTLLGAQVLVWGAEGLARQAGLSEGFVGLSIVAIGTSLPELMTAVHAARHGESDLLVGNLTGSSVFNALAVGGLVALVGSPVPLDATLTGPGTWLMLGVSVLSLVFMGRRFIVTRWEGAVLLAVFAVSMPLLATV
jgi:cation:H+ antiporter